jgi:aminopeptidase-like protein
MNNLPFNTFELEQYFDRLWPICRSISGNGLRTSFNILQEIIPLSLKEYPTGTQVYDWEIPKEWNIEDAYIIAPDGKKICDFSQNNLHIVNYSIPFEG